MIPGILADHEKALCREVISDWSERGALTFRISHSSAVGTENAVPVLIGLGFLLGAILLRSAGQLNWLGLLLMLAAAVGCGRAAVRNTQERRTKSRTGTITLLPDALVYAVEDRQGNAEQLTLPWQNMTCSSSDNELTVWVLNTGSFSTPTRCIADYGRLRAALISRVGLTEERLIQV